MARQSSHSLLSTAFRKRKKDIPQFSLRALATKMRISPGYLSKVLNGHKPLTKELIQEFRVHLKLDTLLFSQLVEKFENEMLKSKLGSLGKQHLKRQKASEVEIYELATAESEWILSRWYNIAILDLFTTSDFREDFVWIAERLQIQSKEAQEAVLALHQVGLLYRDENNILKKKHSKMRFSTRMSKLVVRQFHAMQMKRALRVLEHKTNQKDFDNRLITGVTVAANIENFNKARDHLHRALYEAVEILSQGECSEVFQMNLRNPHFKQVVDEWILQTPEV